MRRPETNADNFSLSVILPAYNEDKNIENTLAKIFATLPSLTCDYEVIVVDDGSRDRTQVILTGLRKRYDRLEIVRHGANRGYGNALISGFNKADKDYIFFMDSDMQFDFSEIDRLLLFKDNYDIVAGVRIDRKDSLMRDLIGTIFNFLVKFLFGIPIMDVDCGFKLFKKSVLKNLGLYSPGALINTEILAKAMRNNKTIMLVGVTHYPRKRGRQTGASARVIFRAMKEIVKLKYRLMRTA